MAGIGLTNLTAAIENVEVVDNAQEVGGGDVLAKGLDFLKSRISLVGPNASHAEFTVRVKYDGGSHVVRKRFSEFSQLHDLLKGLFPGGLNFDLPSKTMIRHFTAEALEDRRHALNAHLKELCRNRQVVSTQQVQIFLGLTGAGAAQQAPPISGGPPIHGAPPIHGGPPSSGGYGGNAGYNKSSYSRASGFGDRPDSDDNLIGWDS